MLILFGLIWPSLKKKRAFYPTAIARSTTTNWAERAADEQVPAQFPFSDCLARPAGSFQKIFIGNWTEEAEHPSGRCESLPPTAAAAWRAAAFSVPSLHGTVSEGTAREQLLVRPTEEGAAQIVIDFCACPTCPARFGTESALRAHLKASLVICGLCGKHYCSETLFQAHRCPLF
uniref:C2H2-type domain-containing protein n=1 Tax=Globodera pallida TaxID=36090 RepID=A0A183BS83_GLOPA